MNTCIKKISFQTRSKRVVILMQIKEYIYVFNGQYMFYLKRHIIFKPYSNKLHIKYIVYQNK